jgi:tetratricopeptide (TPR) repeat protein
VLFRSKITVTPEEKKQLARSRLINPEAHEAYLKGRFFINKGNEADVRKGIAYYEKATAKDSDYALAYAGLAEGYDWLWSLAVMPAKDAFPKMKTLAMKALSIDENLPEAYTIIAEVTLGEWNWQTAEENYRRAVGLNQNYATAHAYYAWYLQMMRRNEEALREAKRAVEIDPLWPMSRAILAQAFMFGNQFDSAMTQINEALSIDSTVALGYAYLGDFYLWRGSFAKAIEQYQKGIALGDSEEIPLVAYCYARSGNAMRARQILADQKTKNIPSAFYSIAYMGLGESDRAFEHLERAYEEHHLGLLVTISVPHGFDTKLDSFRADPRFQALVKKMGLEGIER